MIFAVMSGKRISTPARDQTGYLRSIKAHVASKKRLPFLELAIKTESRSAGCDSTQSYSSSMGMNGDTCIFFFG